MNGLDNPSVTVQNEEAETGVKNPEKQRKSKAVLDGPTSLYKHYAKGRKLLYVGISLSVLQRLLQHRQDSPWFDEIQTIVIKKYPTRKAAKAAEAALIKRHSPPHNTQHHPNWLRRHILRTFGSYEGWRRYADLLEAGFTVDEACTKLGIKNRRRKKPHNAETRISLTTDIARGEQQ